VPKSGSDVGGSRRPRGWEIDIRSGGVVIARHVPSGAVVTGSLVLRAGSSGARIRISRYDYTVVGGIVIDGPPAPIEWIEDSVNDPGMMQVALDALRLAPIDEGHALPMRLPAAMLEQRERPDAFYSHVAALVRICKTHKISYGPRLASDNNVSEGTVRSWVHEARRRGLLDQPNDD
jgi:hypothetical protein